MKCSPLCLIGFLVYLPQAPAHEELTEGNERRMLRYGGRERKRGGGGGGRGKGRGKGKGKGKGKGFGGGEPGKGKGGCSDLRAFIGTYPGYNDTNSDFPKKGYVGINFDDSSNSFRMEFELYNFAPCLKCAIYIHDGTSCDDEASVGVPYFTGAASPWSVDTSYYEQFKNFNKSTGQLLLNNGYNETQNADKTIVVYSEGDSTKVGCGVLKGKRGWMGDFSDKIDEWMDQLTSGDWTGMFDGWKD